MLNMATEFTATVDTARLTSLREKYIVRILLLVTAVTYVGTIRFDFVYDDFPQIVNNPFLKAWRYAPQYFVSSVWKQLAPSLPGHYYRPLFLLLLRTNYALFAGRPLGWHLAAIGLHVLVTWLVYLVVRKMTGQFTTAWLAALIFGVHPIHHEVVAWASGMTESLFAVLFLLAFLAYLRSRQGPKGLWMTLSCALYALALLSKETAIVLPALVFAHGWFESNPAESESCAENPDRLRSAFKPAIPFLPIAFVYLLVRGRILAGLGHSIPHVSFVTWLFTLPSILLFYVKNWFFPFRLAESYDLYYQPKLSPLHVLLPAITLIALVVAFWFLRNRLGAKAVGFAAAWILIPLLPALDTFVFRPDELVHDRYFYVPSIGAALLIALLIERAARTRLEVFGQPAHVVATGLALTILLASFTGWQVTFWRSDYALFSRAHQIAPQNANVLNNLGLELMSRYDLEAAQKLLETGYQNNPSDFHFPLNLGRLYYMKHDYPKAESLMLRAESLAPDLADTYVFLGQIQLRQRRLKEAQETLRHAVALNPYSATYRTSYGIVLALNGDCADADQQFEAALALDPGDAVTQGQMSRCRSELSPAAAPATRPGQL
jgi:tetratricopeptide (TPR) repeat protein